MKKLIIFCFICFSNIIYANPVIIYQYYINGINTTRQEADKNTNRLNKDLKYQNYLKGNLISNEISLLYNEKPSPIDAGIFKQIIDSLLQKANEKYNFALEDVVDSVMEVYGFIYPKTLMTILNYLILFKNILMSYILQQDLILIKL